MDHRDATEGERQLWALIEERMRPGVDLARIDAEIWARFGQTSAVVFTDLTGFSRMVAEFGIVHFLQEIHEQRGLFLPIVEAHDGLLVKQEADSMLLLFERPEQALACTIEMNRRSHAVNRDRAPEDRVLLCAGIGYGPLLRVGDRDVFGQEVNASSKLGEDIATAGEILVTESVRAELGPHPGVGFEVLSTRVAGSATNYRVLYALE